MEQFGGISFSEQHLQQLQTPCYVINESAVEENLKKINRIQEETGAKVLLALKGFAMWSLFPLIKKYLPGITASSLNEALLGKEEFGGELHVYAPAYTDREFSEIVQIADHISFNSANQFQKFKSQVSKQRRPIQCAVRINPEHSEVSTSIYDPCAPFSRLGMTLDHFKKFEKELDGISGLHFHTLCELNADALARTLKIVEEKFGYYFSKLSWINFGGGHHISRSDYDIELLIQTIHNFQNKYKLQVYLEPGEAIALNTGVLVSEVLDVFNNGMDIAILDTSAAAHMPDVLEMPYRPEILGAAMANQRRYTYRLGGTTCLAGDVIGDYSFDEPLQPGDKLIFGDMAHYTMVKNNTFNGVQLPTIYKFNSQNQRLELVKSFEYKDYKSRLS